LSNPLLNVVIIGGGFSGTMLAVHLLRGTSDLSIAIIDPSKLPGRGLAYGSEYKCHLMNVPAGNMSAFPSDPHHFLRWSREFYEPWVQPRSFLPRGVYGAYVGSILDEARRNAPASRYRWIQDEVLSVRRAGNYYALEMKTGPELRAQNIVLAIGNFPPSNPTIRGITERSRRYVPFAWTKGILNSIPADGSVLLVGSGLTSLDMAISLKSRGFQGRIHILSRHGLIPQRQQVSSPWPQFWNETSPRTTRGLFRLVRAEVQRAAEQSVSWHAVVDSLRPVAAQIWQSLPTSERRRFLRHARPYWEVHRHRVAPEIGDLIQDLIQDGTIQIHAGRVTQYREDEDGAEIIYHLRGSGVQSTLRVDRVINCTGSENDCRRIESSLLASLFVQGLAKPDMLSLGLEVDHTGALISGSGHPSRSLFALGPVRKGCLWETTAVPEIRQQAEGLADHLIANFDRSACRNEFVRTA
jgi:uncharacterized NAD(P)/FAD-binding protein YdhS